MTRDNHFHRLWTSAVGKPSYVKAEWRELLARFEAAEYGGRVEEAQRLLEEAEALAVRQGAEGSTRSPMTHEESRAALRHTMTEAAAVVANPLVIGEMDRLARCASMLCLVVGELEERLVRMEEQPGETEADVVRRVLAEERERCACVAESFVDPDWPNDDQSAQAKSIAASIREQRGG